MVAAEQQRPAEAGRVGGDDLFQPAPAKPERLLDMREGGVDDGRAEHHHQLRGRDDEQRQALVALATARSPCGGGRFPGW